jgi:hypothetical protein
MKKKILLVGDGNHQFITNYALWLKNDSEKRFIIDVLSYTAVINRNRPFYDTIHEVNCGGGLLYLLSQIKWVRAVYRQYQLNEIIKRLPKYNIVHFHYVGLDSYLLIKKIKKNISGKIILSIWGSDLYKIPFICTKRFAKVCLIGDFITFSNEKTLEFFKNKFKWKKCNLKVCRFGLTPLQNLKELQLSKKKCKNCLGWNLEKIAITIGYNSSLAQQHLLIINQFDTNEIKKFKNNIILVFLLTYGGNKKYKNHILKSIKKLPFEYRIYDNYLSDLEVAKIRKASDIMIQLQKTDQLSGSMLEHLFANNVVITGSWLPYETLKEKCWFIEIDRIKELSMLVPEIIGNFKKYKSNTIGNSFAIDKLSSWEINIEKWKQLYFS